MCGGRYHGGRGGGEGDCVTSTIQARLMRRLKDRESKRVKDPFHHGDLCRRTLLSPPPHPSFSPPGAPRTGR